MDTHILITGAGGTVGCALTRFYLSQGAQVYAVDRSEEAVARLLDMRKECTYRGTLHIFFEDIRDHSFHDRFSRMKELECIIHCAALKHVSVGAEFPERVFSENVAVFKRIEALVHKNTSIKKVVVCSSDKAAHPDSTMGRSKREIELLCEGIHIRDVQFVNVRFANILYSTGSILQKLEACITTRETFFIRDERMTRYLLTRQEVIALIDFALHYGRHGDVICLPVSAARIRDLVTEYLSMRGAGISVEVGSNPFSESIHEALFNEHEVEHVYKRGGYYIYNKTSIGNLEESEKNHVLSSSHALSDDVLNKLYA